VDEAPVVSEGNFSVTELRVMTFNIRVRTVLDVFNPWHRRRELVLDRIRAFDPDLLGTQELLFAPQAEDLIAALDGYTFFGAGRRDGQRQGETCGVFFKSEKFERLDGGHFWLSRTPEQPGSRLPGTLLPRIVTWLRLRVRRGGEIVWFNTHFPVFPAGARAMAAKMLAERIGSIAPDMACIVTGDFNDAPASPAHRALVAAGFRDAYRAAHPEPSDDEATLHHFRGRTRGQRIDWILATPAFTCINAAVDQTRGANGYASDHFPVTAVLRLA
jgi:endonuclease/exonuclease/phosphatase family metal-dependent hydrolase